MTIEKTTKKKVTPFGRLCKQIRNENEDVLKDLATKVGCSVAFLSAIELGQKKIPKSLVETIISIYKLNKKEQSELIYAASISQPYIKIELDGMDDTDREIVKLFGDKYSHLKSSEKKAIQEILLGSKK